MRRGSCNERHHVRRLLPEYNAATLVGVSARQNHAQHRDAEFAQSIRMYFASSIENLQPGNPSDKTVEQQPRKKQKKAQAEKKTDDCDTISSSDEF